jgi:hypothetical protein
MGTLTKVDRTPLELWTACPMTFHAGKGEFIVIPKFTPCRKPAYTQKMRDELDHKSRMQLRDEKDFWVFVDLEGLLRTIKRSALLTQKEYDAEREQGRAALAMLRAKSKRTVAEGGAGRDNGVAVVAGEDAPGSEREGAGG